MAVSLTSPRSITIGISLFLASALMTVTLRSSSRRWPSRIGRLSLSSSSNADPDAPRIAFATFLAGPADDSSFGEEIDDNDDGYFLSARVLIYQLMHSSTAGTNSSIPFLVLCTPNVSERKRRRLAADGATIVPVSTLEADWVHPGAERWKDVLTKLRLWQMVQYAKICFIDADMLVTQRLDGVFYDEATITQHSLSNPSALQSDEAALPRTYIFATHADFWGYDHPYPPETDSTYLNCGFFVFAPDVKMFDYYLSLLALPGRFDTTFPEQNLLNYAHRREGNMPWKPVWYGWNVNWPSKKDWEGGAKSFHAKYWDDDPSHDPLLKSIWREQRAEMEGFYRGRDAALANLQW